MPKFHGRSAVVKIEDSGGTLRTISNDVNNVDTPSDVDQAEVTGFGDTGKNYVLGLSDSKISLSGAVNTTATTGGHAVLSGLLRGTGTGGSAGYDFQFFPNGTATGMPVFKGRVLLGSYNVKTPVGGAATYDASLLPATTAGVTWGVA